MDSSYIQFTNVWSSYEQTVGQFNQELQNPALYINGDFIRVQVGSHFHSLDDLVKKLFSFREELFDENGDGLNYHAAAQKLAPLIKTASSQDLSFSSRIYKLFACYCFCFEDCYQEYQKQCIMADAKLTSDEFLRKLPRIDDEFEVGSTEIY